MALDTHTAYAQPAVAPVEPQTIDITGLHANWGERAVTVAATSIAVLIVALIAVLMGMA